jgi:putative component of toxin-antitoxin plasmid stabilization module
MERLEGKGEHIYFSGKTRTTMMQLLAEGKCSTKAEVVRKGIEMLAAAFDRVYTVPGVTTQEKASLGGD